MDNIHMKGTGCHKWSLSLHDANVSQCKLSYFCCVQLNWVIWKRTTTTPICCHMYDLVRFNSIEYHHIRMYIHILGSLNLTSKPYEIANCLREEVPKYMNKFQIYECQLVQNK